MKTYNPADYGLDCIDWFEIAGFLNDVEYCMSKSNGADVRDIADSVWESGYSENGEGFRRLAMQVLDDYPTVH